ncbi:hypothetical protein BS78_02G107600 [Paspalum vaginatum]|nr:hypothetical protein BS78_02G107600 [Paspalum vaginatum]
MAKPGKLQYVTVLGMSLVALFLLSSIVRDVAATKGAISYHTMSADEDDGRKKSLFRPSGIANKYQRGCENIYHCRGKAKAL